MRLHNQDDDTVFSTLAILLTRAEASELRDKLELLLESGSDHEHVLSEDYQKEITVSVYEESNISGFDERAQKLIREDK